jgi:hypothetical protein
MKARWGLAAVLLLATAGPARSILPPIEPESAPFAYNTKTPPEWTPGSGRRFQESAIEAEPWLRRVELIGRRDIYCLV